MAEFGRGTLKDFNVQEGSGFDQTAKHSGKPESMPDVGGHW